MTTSSRQRNAWFNGNLNGNSVNIHMDALASCSHDHINDRISYTFVTALSLAQSQHRPGSEGSTYIQRQGFATILHLVAIDSDERLTILEQTLLETDENKLHARPGVLADVVGDARDVGVVKRGVDLVKHEERRWLV